MEQTEDPINEFISVLKNKRNQKDKGVLILVGPAQDLSKLEEACFSSKLALNKCLTARYTLKVESPEVVFGTLVKQLISDIGTYYMRSYMSLNSSDLMKSRKQ